MTTTQHTPYDEELDMLEENSSFTDACVIAALEGKVEGYLRAKAEDAPLLGALEAIRKVVIPREHEEAWQMVTGVRNILYDVDAQAEKGGRQ